MSCETCKYTNEDGNGTHCRGCIHNAEDHYKPITNADRIRNMTDEELALIIMCPYDNLPGECTCEEDDSRANCIKCCLEWLQAEVKEGDSDAT